MGVLTMDEYIDREALRKILENWRDAHADVDDEQGCGLLEDVIWEVDAQPAADVAPVVHAMWIPSESDFDDDDTLFDVEEWCDWQCSACREDICYDDPMPLRLLPKFCPNCGAKMDGGEDAEG